MTIQTGLDYIRSRSIVDCDTMDEQVAKTLGPFHDCTSNQAIAYNELTKPEHAELLQSSHTKAKALIQEYPGLTIEELAIEIAMISLSLRIAPHITGHIHIQTNPYYSYSTEKTIVNALRTSIHPSIHPSPLHAHNRTTEPPLTPPLCTHKTGIVNLTHQLSPTHPQSRICIKIPSTWEGLKACQVLEQAGVRTLATTLFTMPQAILAAEVGCTYIAPYVNQLRVHFEPGFKDPSPLLHFSALVQKYYASIGSQTQVLPASLTSTNEIFALAGVQHITIAPGLLDELAKPLLEGKVPVESLFESPAVVEAAVPGKEVSYVGDEAGYRIAFTRDANGLSEEKLTQGYTTI
ncbi:transaldolase [Aspergillus niger]|uniref:Transaldolase n=1 Tax=Aspergillus niger TaxID=5061 RepID=A0A124BWL7_ASPNG|nr:transaldolase [Aspergillus niger]